VCHSKIGSQCLSWVNRVGLMRRPRSRHVRFAPRATVADQNVIRRDVAITGLMHRSKDDVHGLAYSITSSAVASSVGGTSRPRALAVLRLMTSSNLVGSWTGRSPAFSPRRMRSIPAVRDEPAFAREIAEYRRQAIPRRQFNDELAIGIGALKGVRSNFGSGSVRYGVFAARIISA
jgi:hypothetical protein